MKRQEKKKLWLDDERKEPVGWIRAKTATHAVILLATEMFDEVSLDHDLGTCKTCKANGEKACECAGDGYQVACWLEEVVKTHDKFPIPTVHVHTQNPAARKKMLQAVDSINREKSLRVIAA